MGTCLIRKEQLGVNPKIANYIYRRFYQLCHLGSSPWKPGHLLVLVVPQIIKEKTRSHQKKGIEPNLSRKAYQAFISYTFLFPSFLRAKNNEKFLVDLLSFFIIFLSFFLHRTRSEEMIHHVCSADGRIWCEFRPANIGFSMAFSQILFWRCVLSLFARFMLCLLDEFWRNKKVGSDLYAFGNAFGSHSTVPVAAPRL